MKKAILAVLIGALVAGVTLAAPPVENINPRLHPNLAAAQHLSREAHAKIVAAQVANQWDMEGHAQKAKELLELVNVELKLAAEAANRHHK